MGAAVHALERALPHRAVTDTHRRKTDSMHSMGLLPANIRNAALDAITTNSSSKPCISHPPHRIPRETAGLNDALSSLRFDRGRELEGKPSPTYLARGSYAPHAPHLNSARGHAPTRSPCYARNRWGPNRICYLCRTCAFDANAAAPQYFLWAERSAMCANIFADMTGIRIDAWSPDTACARWAWNANDLKHDCIRLPLRG